VAKTVHTPPIPPKPDIVFLTDATGSMGGVISNVQSNATAVMGTVRMAQSQADFAAAEYRDAPPFCNDAFIFKLNQAITASVPDVQTGINQWAAAGGCDIPESDINALYQVATQSAVGFRSDSTRIIVWFGDSPSHDPSNGITEAQATAALQAAHIQVIAVPFDHSASNGGEVLDSLGQATRITAATGGFLLPSQSTDTAVSDAILMGLHNLPVTVTPTPSACDPNLSVSWDAPSKTATSGSDVPFNETIAVSPSSPFGTTLTCHIDFLLNGMNAGADFGEDITITVPAHGTTLTYTGDTTQDFDDQATLKAHLVDAVKGTPISGKIVSLSMGSQSCPPGTMTDGSGDASCVITVNQPAGSNPISASFAGDAQYLPSNASGTFNVTLEETTTKITNGAVVAVSGGNATLSANLTEDGTTPINGRSLTLTLGSHSCPATTNPSGDANCTVSGLNNTTDLGPQIETASFAGDTFYQPSSDKLNVIVFAYLGQGGFVLGDKNPASGTQTFWGAQWSKLNSLSGGSAPSAFKGFEDTLSNPTCHAPWTTDTGNSTPPPAGPLPSYMGVIVSSSISQSGSTISGDTAQIVVVKTDPGYAGDPGHAGTGTIVATFCK
jgi:hypothetical protein